MAVDDDVLSELRRGYDQLTNSQKRIAEAIVADPELVAFGTVDKLASQLGVSPSTIVRFAYRLGLEGYQDLQERIRRNVRAQMRTNLASDDPGSVLDHLVNTPYADSVRRDLENINRSVLDLTAEALDSAVTALRKARRLHVAGHLASDGLASFAALVLGRLHSDTVLLRNDGMLAPALYELSRDDVLLVFSFPPYALHSLKVVQAAQARKAQIIAITDSVISPVAQQADIVLPVRVSGVTTQNSLVAPLVVVNAIVNAFAGTAKAAGRYRDIMRSMIAWDTFVLRDELDGA